MQCATRASDIISHQGTIFLTFSTVATDEVRKEVELAKIRNDQSHRDRIRFCVNDSVRQYDDAQI
jgi:hypothetical protein